MKIYQAKHLFRNEQGDYLTQTFILQAENMAQLSGFALEAAFRFSDVGYRERGEYSVQEKGALMEVLDDSGAVVVQVFLEPALEMV